MAFCDEDDDEEHCELLAIEPAAVLIKGPGGPCITCMGCGGGDKGQLLSKRLKEEARVLLATGGGDRGISTIGLGDRVGIKSD